MSAYDSPPRSPPPAARCWPSSRRPRSARSSPPRRASYDAPTYGPQTLTQLRRLLADEKRQGFAVEDSFITPGVASVASAALDHAGHPAAAISVTFRTDAVPPSDRHLLAHRIRQAATALTRRLHG